MCDQGEVSHTDTGDTGLVTADGRSFNNASTQLNTIERVEKLEEEVVEMVMVEEGESLDHHSPLCTTQSPPSDVAVVTTGRNGNVTPGTAASDVIITGIQPEAIGMVNELQVVRESKGLHCNSVATFLAVEVHEIMCSQ